MVVILLLATVFGVGAGLLLGGRLDRLRLNRIRLWPALLVAAVLSFSPAVAAGGTAVGVVAGLLLVAVAVANLRLLPAVIVLCAGMGMNLLPLSADGGMPVSASALASAQHETVARARAAHLTGRHHIQRPGDCFTDIDDDISVGMFHSVMSFGDVVICVGVGLLLLELVLPRHLGKTRPSGGSDL